MKTSLLRPGIKYLVSVKDQIIEMTYVGPAFTDPQQHIMYEENPLTINGAEELARSYRYDIRPQQVLSTADCPERADPSAAGQEDHQEDGSSGSRAPDLEVADRGDRLGQVPGDPGEDAEGLA